jgi:nitroreductase
MQNKDIILNNIKNRRSIRKFIDKDIEQTKLDIIFEAARWAPSNCNKQLWKIIVIKDDKIKKDLVDNAGSSTLILKAPVVLCMLHYNDVFLEAYQTSSAVTQNISLMATELDIGTLWLNSKGNADKIKEILNIPDKYIISNFILMGYYDLSKKRTAPKRKPLSNFIMMDKFEGENTLNWSHDPAQWNYKKLKDYQGFICRKTELGTCQDIVNQNEIDIVKETSKKYSSNHLDFFPYDGHILKQLNNNENITIVETSDETALYTKATLSNDNIEVKVFDELIEESDTKYKTMSINYRLERLPYQTRKDLFAFVSKNLNEDGTFYIVSRTNNIFYMIFYKLFIKLLGDNISKTAIYSFFGPFKPLNINETEKVLKKYNFIIEKKRYFFIPPIFESIAQLMHQYRKSKGGNFMHRIETDTLLSSFFKYITKIQLKMNINFFGSIIVFKIKKEKND